MADTLAEVLALLGDNTSGDISEADMREAATYFAKFMQELGGQDLAFGAIADGQQLQRSGTDIIGVAPAGGGGDSFASALPAPATGEWMGFPPWLHPTNFTQSGQTTGLANFLWAWRFAVPATRNYDGFLVPLFNTSGGPNYRVGLYADDGAGFPGALLHGSASLSTGGGRTTPHTFASEEIVAGWYWAAFVSDGNSMSILRASPSTPGMGQSEADIEGNNSNPRIAHAFTFAALPDPFPSSSPSTVMMQYPLCAFIRGGS